MRFDSIFSVMGSIVHRHFSTTLQLSQAVFYQPLSGDFPHLPRTGNLALYATCGVWTNSFVQDLRFGVRMLLRAPGFAVLVTLILALGVGANSAVFSIVNAVLLRPLPYHDPERIFQLDEVNTKGQPSGVAPMDLDAFQQHSNALEQSAVSHWLNATLTGLEGAENVYGVRVTSDMFPMLGVQPALGRLFRPDEFQSGAAAGILLSDRLWKRRFSGSPSVVGKELMVNGRAHPIVGVMPASFYFTQRFEFWMPAQLTAQESGDRMDRWPCLVRLNHGVSPTQALTAIQAIYRNTAPEDQHHGWQIRLTPLHEQVTGSSRPALLVILGAVGFVLLIACFNIANLLLARGSNRSREMAVRAALGAGRARVFRQLLTESMLVSVLGGGVGAVVGAAGAMALIRQLPARMFMPRLEEARMDTGVLLFTLAVSVLTGILFGLMPAWNASRTDVNKALKQGGRAASPRSHTLRNLLVVAEIALSLVLVVGAALMLRSFVCLLEVDPGFNPEHVLTVRVPMPTAIIDKAKQAPYYTRLLDQVRTVPGLEAVGLIAPLPLTDLDANARFAVEGRPMPAGGPELVKLRSVDPGYFRAMGVPLRQGRVFEESDGAGAPQVVVVSESLVKRYFPNEDPIGKRVSMSANGPWMPIIGVVKDVKSLNLADKEQPALYRDYRQFFFAPFANTIVVRTQAADPATIARAVERQIRAANPDQPIVDVLPMPRIVSNSIAQPRFYTVLLVIFAAIALLLAAVGIYGVLSYSVSQRVREIGIRLALGASPGTILRDVVGRAMILMAIGLGLGLAGAFGLTRLLRAQLFEIKPTDPITYAAVSLLLAAVGLAAAYIPARRAMRIDPNQALRCE
jgi:putative ABC transport system permease protein